MIYFVRHGETSLNAECRCTGQIDVELNEKGIVQANELAEKLKDFKFTKIFCSPLLRAKQTAEIINQKHGKEIVFVDGFKERNCGSRQGVCYKDLTEQDDIDFFGNPKKYGAETDDEFYDRCIGEFKKIKKLKGDVLIVAHGGVFRAICCYVTKTLNPLDELWRIKNCEIAKIDKNKILKV